MIDLPSGWEGTTIGEVCEVVGGSTPKTAVARYWGDPIPWVTPDDLSRHDGVWVSGGARSLTQEGFQSASLRMLPPGAVLFSSRAPIGYVAIAEVPLCTNQGFKSVVSPRGLNSRYLYWYLLHANSLIESMASGTTFKEISKRRMQEVPLPIAPTAEQERIVAAIEEHLSRLEAAAAAVRSATARLELLESRAVDEAFVSYVERVPTSEVAEVRGGIQKQPKRQPKENRAPFLRVANVGHGRLALDEVHEVELFEGELERYRLRPGDLLVVEGNGSPDQIGRSAVWRGEIPDCVHQNHLIRVRPGPSLDPEFLGLYWNAPSARQQLTSVASSTSGLYTLSTSKVKQVEVPVAPLGEQRSMVTRLAAQLEQFSRLRAQLGTAAKRNGALRLSVLAAAFSGRLVPQDPAEEPASVLLDRIRAERAAAARSKRTRKAKSS